MNHGPFLRALVFASVAGLLAGCHTDPNVRKQKYLVSGNRYSAQGDYRAAAIQYENSLKADKNFADAHYALGKAYLHMGAYGAALREFSRTVDLQPLNYHARLDLGGMLFAAGRTEDAYRQASAVLKSHPDNPDVHALLSAIAERKGDRSKALAEIQRALELDPNRSGFYDNLAALQRRDPSQAGLAEANLKKAIAVDSKSVDAKLLLSGFYLDANRMAEAEQAARDAIQTDPHSIAARTNLAQIYLKEGKQGQAVEVLRQASQDLAGDPQGVRLLADYYTASGQFENARTEFARLVSAYPKNDDLRKGYLRALIQVRDYATARTEATELLKEDSKDPEIVGLNGIIELNDGHASDAVSALEDGARDFPQDTFIQYWLGMAALAKGDTALAEKSFQQVVSVKPGAIDALSQLAQLAERQGNANLLSDVAGKAITALPSLPAGYVWRAEVEMHNSDANKAEADLETAIHLSPRNPEPYLELGELRFSQKRFAEGVNLLRQALESDPNLVPAARLLVGYYLYNKQPQQSIELLDAQIQKVPGNSGMLDLLGAVQVQQNKLDDAAATIQKAMKLNPADAEAATLFVRIAVQQGKIGNAISSWQQWTVAHPKDANAMALLGTLEQSNGNKQGAERDYQRALQIQPQQPVAANNLAYLMLEDGGNPDVALSLAQLARRAMPNSPNTADTLAWAYYSKGAYAFARDLLEGAVKSDPGSAAMEYHLGMVYMKMQNKHDAALHLNRAASLGHGTPVATDAEKALQQL